MSTATSTPTRKRTRSGSRSSRCPGRWGAGGGVKPDGGGDVAANREEEGEWVAALGGPGARTAPAGRPAELPVNFSRRETLEGVRLREVWGRRCGALRLE